MSTKNQEKTVWDIVQTSILNTAKFPRKDTILTILPKPEPTSCMEDGKYGKQKVYVVRSVQLGVIKVSQAQFLKICEAFKGDYSSPVDVQF